MLFRTGLDKPRLSGGRESQPKGKEKYVCHIQQPLSSRVTKTGLFSSSFWAPCNNQRCLHDTKTWKLNPLAWWHVLPSCLLLQFYLYITAIVHRAKKHYSSNLSRFWGNYFLNLWYNFCRQNEESGDLTLKELGKDTGHSALALDHLTHNNNKLSFYTLGLMGLSKYGAHTHTCTCAYMHTHTKQVVVP